MHGSAARFVAFLFLAACAGCTLDDTTPVSPGNPSPTPGTDKAVLAGMVRGVVRWSGEVPFGNRPYLPKVDPATQGIDGAIVLLRDLGPDPARRWPHGPVRVEVRDKQIKIVQDGQSSAIGLVRMGDEIEVVSVDAEFHSLRGRGAATLAIPLPEANRVARRRLARPGVVTISSAANHPAMSAYLLVVDSGNVTRTNARGEFAFPEVPAGERTLACWMPNWNVKRRERDPASGLVARLHFEAPVERTRRIAVQAGGTSDATITWKQAEIAGK